LKDSTKKPAAPDSSILRESMVISSPAARQPDRNRLPAAKDLLNQHNHYRDCMTILSFLKTFGLPDSIVILPPLRNAMPWINKKHEDKPCLVIPVETLYSSETIHDMCKCLQAALIELYTEHEGPEYFPQIMPIFKPSDRQLHGAGAEHIRARFKQQTDDGVPHDHQKLAGITIAFNPYIGVPISDQVVFINQKAEEMERYVRKACGLDSSQSTYLS
jgi:hypothetical protein